MIAALRLLGFMIGVLLISPLQLAARGFKTFDPLTLPRYFHTGLLHLIGIRARFHGTMSTALPTFFVSNHISYLDILVLGSKIPASFVAKSEVASWPLFGWLAKLQNTVFIERRAIRAKAQSGTLRERLVNNRSLILFPEGTSTDGQTVLPFKSSLFAIAEESLPNGQSLTIQPITISCTRFGGLPIGRLWRPRYAWYGDMTLLKHLWSVFTDGSFTVDVIFHPPITTDAFPNRKAIALHCEITIRQGLEACLTGKQDEFNI